MSACPHCGQTMPPRPPRIIRKSFQRIELGMIVDFGGLIGFQAVTGYSRTGDKVLLSTVRGGQLSGRPAQFVRVARRTHEQHA